MRRLSATESAARRLEITGEMDRHAAEALYIELRRLARLHGVDVTAFRAEKLEETLPGATSV